ncbi:signal peptidase I [Pendulispora brunnea]|uniref:Signal peptidase I n=1 Tax=Pendulispora brunnea TaxID=2905690 RepID=A0ABZ2K9S9_9BACT
MDRNREREPRSRVLAFILSFIFIGAGHAYLGQTRRGLWLLGVGFGCLCLAAGVLAIAGPLTIAGVLLAVLTLALYRLVLAVDTLLIPEEQFVYLSWGRVVLQGMGLAVLGFALAILTRTFVLEAFKIPSGAMIPTLFVEDHIFANKLTYRIREPVRGEVAIFAFPEKPEQDFAKRVIGRGGDRVEAKQGHPWINGWEVPHCVLGTATLRRGLEGEAPRPYQIEVEFLEGKAFLTMFDLQNQSVEYQGPYAVAQGEFFVMGDNRHNSYDSRLWFAGQGGGVPRDLMHAPATLIWFSVNASGLDWSGFGRSVDGRSLSLPSQLHALEPQFEKCMKEAPPFDRTVPPARVDR